MITGTFNNWNIVALPPKAFSQAQFSMQDKIGAQVSPFTQQAQMLDWQVDWWEATASLPAMTRHDAQQWTAFLAECRGMSAAFFVGDPLAKIPSGFARGVPVVNGSNAARSTTLSVRGFNPNVARQLRAGDYLQLGNRLHLNLDDVSSDGSGIASLHLWPRIREAPKDGDPIILRYPKGLFRLADNKRSYSLTNSKTYGISLTLTEAL